MRKPTLLFVLVLFSACGGGGGGGGLDLDPIPVAFGLVSSTTSSTVFVDLSNPYGQSATVTQLSVEGPFQLGVGSLPQVVDPAADFQLPVFFTPGGTTGPRTGLIVIEFTAGSNSVPLDLELSANGEPVRLDVLTTQIDFGDVELGDMADDMIEITNVSTLSPAHIAPVTLPDPAFEILTPLPLTIAPGATEDLMVRYAPDVPGARSGPAVIQSEDPLGPYEVPLLATTSGRQIIDFGTVSFDTSLTASGVTAQTEDLLFTVPSDAVGFQIEAFVNASTQIGLTKLTGPNGENFEDESFSGFYLQYPDFEAFAAQVPNTDEAQQQVIPGEWTLRIGRLQGNDSNTEVRVIIQRRSGATENEAVLDLNVFLAQAIAPTAATAESDTDLQDIFSRVNTILLQAGVQLGDIDYYDIADVTDGDPTVYDQVSNAEFDDLLRLSGDDAVQEERLNFFLVEEAIGNGVLGVSAKLGGATKNGTGSSGVMGLYIDSPTASERDLVARVTAHEIGHYLGLRHTAESNGTHDFINDTTNCGRSGCTLSTELYLMHWNASPGGAVISSGQGTVIRAHGYMQAAPPSSTTLMLKPLINYTTAADVLGPQAWCGTCGRCKSKHDLGLSPR